MCDPEKNPTGTIRPFGEFQSNAGIIDENRLPQSRRRERMREKVPKKLKKWKNIGDTALVYQIKQNLPPGNKTDLAIAIAKCVKKNTGMEGWGKCKTEDFEAVFAQGV